MADLSAAVLSRVEGIGANCEDLLSRGIPGLAILDEARAVAAAVVDIHPSRHAFAVLSTLDAAVAQGMQSLTAVENEDVPPHLRDWVARMQSLPVGILGGDDAARQSLEDLVYRWARTAYTATNGVSDRQASDLR